MEGPRGGRWRLTNQPSHLEAPLARARPGPGALSAPGYVVAVSVEFRGHEWGVCRGHAQERREVCLGLGTASAYPRGNCTEHISKVIELARSSGLMVKSQWSTPDTSARDGAAEACTSTATERLPQDTCPHRWIGWLGVSLRDIGDTHAAWS